MCLVHSLEDLLGIAVVIQPEKKSKTFVGFRKSGEGLDCSPSITPLALLPPNGDAKLVERFNDALVEDILGDAGTA